MTHDEAQELLAAHALDAVEPDEAERIEEHLRDCPRCRAEFNAHLETAAVLGNSHDEPPVELWDRLSAALDDAPPPLDLSRYRKPPTRTALVLRVASIAAAIAAVVGLATVTIQQRRDIDRVESALEEKSLASAALAAFANPEGRRASLQTADGAVDLRAVVLPDGAGYLVADRILTLPAGRTYQLWAMVDGKPISAGVLGRTPAVTAFHVSDRTRALAVSVEAAGGAAQPSLPALVQGILEV